MLGRHSPLQVRSFRSASDHFDRQASDSPEIAPDGRRDYALYALDPLEAEPAPAGAGTGAAGPSVAVGLGLLSLARGDDGSPPPRVTGTCVRTSTGEDALELVFAIREVGRKHIGMYSC
jgi:hypothetical protein